MNMLDKTLLDKFGIDVNKIFIQFKCRKCGRTWGVNIHSLEDELPNNFGVCINCSAKEFIKTKSNERE